MVRRSFNVFLSDAAVEALKELGQAPEASASQYCWSCHSEGRLVFKLVPRGNVQRGDREGEMIVEGTCEHLVDGFIRTENDPMVCLAWSGVQEREKWALLTPRAAWLAGFRFIQLEAAQIKLLLVMEHEGAYIAVGLAVADPNKPIWDLDKLQGAIRIAEMSRRKPAQWRKPNKEEMELISALGSGPQIRSGA